MNDHEALAHAAGLVARSAADELEKLSAEGRLAAETKSARELCAVLKDALSLERELRADERAAVLTVRFEGEAGDASV